MIKIRKESEFSLLDTEETRLLWDDDIRGGLFSKNKIAFTNDGDGDLLYYNAKGSEVYTPSSTGYVSMARITGNSGDTVVSYSVIDSKIEPDMMTSIWYDDGTKVNNKVKSYDRVAKTITLYDALTAAVTDRNAYVLGAVTSKQWLFPRDTLPSSPSGGSSVGSSVFAKDKAAMATFDGTRWVYGVNLVVTTANRPNNYSSNSIDVGSQVWDSTLKKLIFWTGTTWVDAMGTGV